MPQGVQSRRDLGTGCSRPGFLSTCPCHAGSLSPKDRHAEVRWAFRNLVNEYLDRSVAKSAKVAECSDTFAGFGVGRHR